MAMVSASWPELQYCRRTSSIARCVDAPLVSEASQHWCPFRVCAPTYASAARCPADERQATHRCQVAMRYVNVYRCISEERRIVDLPLGCAQMPDVPCENSGTPSFQFNHCADNRVQHAEGGVDNPISRIVHAPGPFVAPFRVSQTATMSCH
ncbi:hypothetical protein FGB62_5g426 [Gracilaria domingensis]|nr:hypothetical protein FGB62_5g426 [Gracilaria domingensis]